MNGNQNGILGHSNGYKEADALGFPVNDFGNTNVHDNREDPLACDRKDGNKFWEVPELDDSIFFDNNDEIKASNVRDNHNVDLSTINGDNRGGNPFACDIPSSETNEIVAASVTDDQTGSLSNIIHTKRGGNPFECDTKDRNQPWNIPEYESLDFLDDKGNETIDSDSPFTSHSELFENNKHFYSDKGVTDHELSELTVCYRENNFNIVKDICMDEGVPAVDKVLTESWVQGRHRQMKQKVPESLKIVRNTKSKNQRKIKNPKGSLEIGFSKSERALRILKKRKPLKHKPCVSEALDEALRRMELKRGDLPLELIRVFLKRQLEKKNEKESKNASAEVMREFPNALMAIPVIPAENFNNAGSVLDVKLGLDSSSNPFSLRHFRSKNIEPLPISTMQALPFARNGKNSSKVKRRRLCHWCRRSSYRVLIKCSSCKKQYFCLDCIKERRLEQQEIKVKCPICRRDCSCRICKRSELKPNIHKESLRHKRKVPKVQLLNYLVHLLLPVLEKINEEQRIEVEIEANISGKGESDIQIQQASAGDGKLYHCSNCNTSILDYHRICSKCSYRLCLNCCRDSRHGSLTEDCKSEGSNEEQACSSNFERQSRMNHTSTSRQSFSGIHYPSSRSCSNYQACADGSISCPPAEYGGCSDSFLNLRCVFPYTWIKELEISADAILCSYNIQETEHEFSSCSLCRGSDHKDADVDSFINVAERRNSRDKFLYSPSINNLREENLEHFQKHWGEGHPIIVRNVLRNSSNLSWDPVVMFCTYLEKRSKCSLDKETAKAQNHSDWCEVEIARKQIFMGSLEWQTHATMQREIVKFKAWLSSHLFQEQFPGHHAEILQAIPLQEYMNPKSGLLNLAVKLPPEMPQTDLGPSIYISYGGPEELSQAEFISNLCCESYDMVNILASATDVLASKEQVRKIKCLMKNKKPQDHKEITSHSSDQKGKSSLHSGDTEESDLQDATGEQLPDGIAEVPFYSSDSQKGQRYEDRDGNISSDNENDSESESDVSLFCSGSVERSEDSDSDHFFEDVDGAKKEAKTSGAQWDVFSREDVPKLLEYLKRHSSEFTSMRGYSKQVVHPILDQSFFFDAFHKMRLKEEFDVQPWTFEQHLGEAIIIPAGCPYQVKQLKFC